MLIFKVLALAQRKPSLLYKENDGAQKVIIGYQRFLLSHQNEWIRVSY